MGIWAIAHVHFMNYSTFSAFSVLGIALTIALGSVHASRALHSDLLYNILRCPMSFFDTTPLGRIINRFSKDVDICDSNIPQFSQNLVTTLAPLMSTIIVIVYSTPIFIVVVIPLGIVFAVLQVRYIPLLMLPYERFIGRILLSAQYPH